jgi:hypothetical protein
MTKFTTGMKIENISSLNLETSYLYFVSSEIEKGKYHKCKPEATVAEK